MHAQLPDKNVKAWRIRRKVFLFWKGLNRRSRRCSSLPHTADTEINDLHSQLWYNTFTWAHTDTCVSEPEARSPERRHIAAQTGSLAHVRHKLPLSAALFRTHIHQGPLLPGYAGNHLQPSCSEIRQMLLKLQVQNDLGPPELIPEGR